MISIPYGIDIILSWGGSVVKRAKGIYNHSMDTPALQISPKTIEQFCQKHRIRKLAFFGSAVRQDFTLESDIDVLVEFEPGQTPGLDFFLIEAELSQLLGRTVDLQTVSFLSPAIRDHALAEAVTAYELA